jgi:hypothetical protein
MFKFLILVVVIIAAGIGATAQTSARKNSEGRRVTAYDTIKRAGKGSAVSVGPRTTYLKEGLSTEVVVRLLGKPSLISEREERGQTVTTYEFRLGEGQTLVAQFVKGILVSSKTEMRSTDVARLY